MTSEQVANQETNGWLPLRRAISKECGGWKKSVGKERLEEEIPLCNKNKEKGSSERAHSTQERQKKEQPLMKEEKGGS